jgi:UDP-GlcNAc:undecaprenyl-phosphate GlcNAc-1-phosphate transferase
VRIARARGLLDHPDGSRRVHQHPVPRLGGIALWLGASVGLAGWWVMVGPGRSFAGLPSWTPGAVAGLLVMLVTGLVDDIRGIQPRHKLLAQFVAAGLAVAGGFRLDVLSLGGDVALPLGWAAAPLSLLWIVAVTNAINLIDGLDGLAGGITLVSMAALAVSALFSGNAAVLPVLLAIFGGTIGFLRYNHSPATIFLGDVGSLSLGYALALLSVEGARLPNGSVAIVVATFALAFPFLDITIAMLRRWLRGAPLMAADGRHVHHQLLALGLSHPRAVALICLFAGGMALLGLSITYAPPAMTLVVITLGSAVWVLLVVHGARWLHYHELIEAQASFASGFLKARRVIQDRIRARELEIQIRQCGTLEQLELLLVQSPAALGLEGMALCGPRDATIGFSNELALRGAPDRVLRLDCPLALRPGSEPLILRVWWRRCPGRPTMYAERIISVLTPALEDRLPDLMLARAQSIKSEPMVGGGRRARSYSGANVALR